MNKYWPTIPSPVPNTVTPTRAYHIIKGKKRNIKYFSFFSHNKRPLLLKKQLLFG